MSKNIIVKVQASLTAPPSILIYDRSRCIWYQTSNSYEVNAIKEKLNDRLRVFFRANLKNNKIELIEEISDQNW